MASAILRGLLHGVQHLLLERASSVSSVVGPNVKLALSTILLSSLLFVAACGAGGGSKSGSSGGSTPATASGAVTVVAGTTTTGVDITVPAAPSPDLNALVLGVADVNASGGSASNTGAAVTRGTQERVLMFGPGLSGSVKISISGPNDLSVSSIQSITSTKGTPGVEFVIAVPGGAALGARTVYLQKTNGDITTFTGGLEIE